MRLADGDPAPDFTIVDTTGVTRRLEDYRDSRLFLSFHRYAACPMCNLHIHELTEQWNALQQSGLHVLAIFMSGSERLDDQYQARDVPFPLAADPDRSMYDAYGVEYSLTGMLTAFVHPRAMKAFFSGFMPGRIDANTLTLPADFLIGPELTIRRSFYSTNITQHMPMAWIQEFASQSGSCEK
jgi:thioredoxin-dependent peroxiredoxin